MKLTPLNWVATSLEDAAAPSWSIPLLTLAFALLVAVGALALFCYLLKFVMPKIAAIAHTTAKEALSQPLFYVLLALGVFFLGIVFPFLPYNTFGEDIKMLKDSGLQTILVLSIIMALWTSSISIADEIEGRTALTLLSKPIGRRQFIVGKFLGILFPIAVLCIILGVLFLGTVWYKVIYDARETSQASPTVHQCSIEMDLIAPGLLLAFYETMVLTAISVAISTRLPMLPNLIISSSVFVLGHLVPLLANSDAGKHPIVRFMGQFIATVLPVLDHFNIQAAIATGKEVPVTYLGMSLVYCLLYSSFALLFALFLFEDRDLA